MGSTAGATAKPIDITRFVAEQHALGKTDAQIAADFDALNANVAATEGDAAGRAKLESDLGTIHDANSAALIAKLGVKTNNGRQGIAPGAAVDAWLRGGTVGTSAAIESAVAGAAPAPAAGDTEHVGASNSDLNAQATSPVAATEHRGVNNADRNARAANAVAAKMAADKALVAKLQQELGVKVEGNGLVVRGKLDGKTYTWGAQSTQQLPNGGSRRTFTPHTGTIVHDHKIYEVTVQPYSVRTPDGKVSSGATITKWRQV